ncbi:MAG: Arm DNA-binding domain-containing protein [Candidatus Accumulibacter sp.]|jgi:hypothetical protein|nr:Arm DNA-binding domain-containing protein [Accumulibacter sp.]
MPKLVQPLSDARLRAAKSKDKPYRLTDGGGLYLLINPDNSRYWRMDYRLGSRRNTLAFGKFPDVSLSAARDRRKEAMALLVPSCNNT